MVELIEITQWIALVFAAAVIAQIAKILTKRCLGKFCWWNKPALETGSQTAGAKPLSEAEVELEKEKIKSQEKLDKKKIKLEKKRLKKLEKEDE